MQERYQPFRVLLTASGAFNCRQGQGGVGPASSFFLRPTWHQSVARSRGSPSSGFFLVKEPDEPVTVTDEPGRVLPAKAKAKQDPRNGNGGKGESTQGAHPPHLSLALASARQRPTKGVSCGEWPCVGCGERPCEPRARSVARSPRVRDGKPWRAWISGAACAPVVGGMLQDRHRPPDVGGGRSVESGRGSGVTQRGHRSRASVEAPGKPGRRLSSYIKPPCFRVEPGKQRPTFCRFTTPCASPLHTQELSCSKAHTSPIHLGL